jgi:FAD/FMN-containing dehydrogenase
LNAIATKNLVNDIHSRLNTTEVHRIVLPSTVAEIQAEIQAAEAEGRAVSIAAGRHAMGGQQFGEGTVLLDMNLFNRVIAFDAGAGIVEVEAGIQWPELIAYLLDAQVDREEPWGIIQKQTGADRLSIGGALAANVHGRVLGRKPIIDDVESFTLVDGDGQIRTCSRDENYDLFRLAIGGYGLFGVIATVRLRLLRRQKVERVVEKLDIQDLMDAFDQRMADGYLYGDFQFAIDPKGDDFLREGVFSCYRPVDPETPMVTGQRELSTGDWQRLLYLGHVDKRKAVDAYTAHYLATSGQLYWSDTHQMADYLDHYHEGLDRKMGCTVRGSEMITEIYVPRVALPLLMKDVRRDFLEHDVDAIYGTIRLIERDDESMLAWAKHPYACVIFNLHADHTPEGIARIAADFRRLIDRAIAYGGSYYLTYHRYADRTQVETCYPRFGEFLRLKRRYDPAERFQSEWYRHYRAMFADQLGESEAA